MGDKATLAKVRKELEDLYLGVPDDSVNLTFQDLAQVRQHNAEKAKPTRSPTMEIISEKTEKSPRSSPMAKLPSLDFSKGLEATFPSHHHHYREEDSAWGRNGHNGHYGHHRHHIDNGGGDQRSVIYDDTSHVSVAYGPERGRRRPGIPHSNICALCCNYIYICRHRCLVCGRVYCRQCVNVGMGEMAEGRKCIECLGRRFSQRYIHKAGNVGWCMGYRSLVKQQELKWAERGARRSGENRYGNTVIVSRSRSPVGLATPSRQHTPATPSFVAASPYSPTSHHPMPF